MPKLLRMAGYVRRQIVLARIPRVGVREFAYTVTCVIDAVTFLEQEDLTVQPQPSLTTYAATPTGNNDRVAYTMIVPRGQLRRK